MTLKVKKRMFAARAKYRRTLRVERAKRTSSPSTPTTSWRKKQQILPNSYAKSQTAHYARTKDFTSVQTRLDWELSNQLTTSKPQVILAST